MSQFGVSGNPEVSNVYSTPEPGAIIADDEVVAKNEIGYVTFSAVTPYYILPSVL